MSLECIAEVYKITISPIEIMSKNHHLLKRKHWIFDLDGTLTIAVHDFNAIRKELGIPEGKLWQELQNGNSIEINGKNIDSSQVTGEKRPGKKIGISGDTRPTQKLKEFFKNSDYLSFDCTFSYELKDRAIETNHSTAKEAAELAKDANVKNLILTHFSARYSDESVLIDEAKQTHNSVIAAKDLLEIDV